MNKTTATGDGLSILILCDYAPHHSWMSFATWYSFSKMLPDAKIGISCNRLPVDGSMFSWVKKLKVPMKLHPPMSKSERVESFFDGKTLLMVEPDVLMLRESDVSFLDQIPFGKSDKIWVVNDPKAESVSVDLCNNVREEKISTFADYPDGWGNFVATSWINKSSSPFSHRFGKQMMTSNEVRVEKLWQKLAVLFQTVSRG